MKFEDLTAEYIMSQKWYCANEDNQCGVYIKYRCNTCDTLGTRTCGILRPNPNFKYPEVYQRLCELICEEHHKRLSITLADTNEQYLSTFNTETK